MKLDTYPEHPYRDLADSLAGPIPALISLNPGIQVIHP
jgi:hypothetical protein